MKLRNDWAWNQPINPRVVREESTATEMPITIRSLGGEAAQVANIGPVPLSQVIVGRGDLRLELEGLVVCGNRLIDFALLLRDEAQVEMSVDELGVDLNRSSVGCGGLVQLTV
jgi:hypothetical protein